jgi:DNA-binding CsgD family transcriptional regulator
MNTPLSKDVIKKIKELRLDGFTTRHIASLLQCSAGSVLYHTNQSYKKSLLGKGVRYSGKRLDQEEQNKMLEMLESGASNMDIKKSTNISLSTIRKYRKPDQFRTYQLNRRNKATRKRQIWVDLKNERHNKCELCGYDRHPKCLDFHHKNPKDKLFTISQSEGRNIDAVYAEAAKCILVCKNCHALIHAGVIEITLTY